jgi:DNA-directed RNA polymerase specialized sigma24 family protein
MNNADTVAEIRAFYEKMRKRMIHDQERALGQLARAEAAALKPFEQKPATPPSNGKTPRVRASRLNPDVQKVILGAMSNEVGYTINEIADLSHASRSQVKSALALAVKAGTVAGDLSKRNRKFVLTTTAEQAHA